MPNINKIKLSGTSYDIQDLNAPKTVTLTQAQYDALVDKDPNTFYIISDASTGDLSQYWTSAQTQSAITQATSGITERIGEDEEVTAAALNTLNDAVSGKVDTTAFTAYSASVETALSGKQDTLVSSTNIKTINNESILGSGNIDIQGGSTYTAGRGISIANDIISLNLPISAGTGTASIVEGGNSTRATGSQSHAEGYSTSATSQGTHSEGMYSKASNTAAHAEGSNTIASAFGSHSEGYYTTASGQYGSHAEGNHTTANGQSSHAEGSYTTASGNYSHAEGYSTSASGSCSHAEGQVTRANNQSEHASGQFNVSTKASDTFGDSGNTLFSVGNGTADDARHNAFEIRQNGDIYLSLNGQDVKLQDQLGGGTVDQTIISGSTNAVAGGAVYNKIDEVEQVTARALNDVHESLSGKADTSAVTEVQDSLSGYVATSAVTSAVTSGSTSVITSGGVYEQMGGLKLLKLTQLQYDALVTKDSNTLYIIIN